ncbi:MAG: GNAT family protein [Thermoguttaceae bacterium]|jgi:RimJ/RimL family protein N-acetyltransferase
MFDPAYLPMLFAFTTDGSHLDEPSLDPRYHFQFWRPGPFRIIPPGTSYKFACWWLAHYLRIFRAPGYMVLYVMHKERIVHRTCILPGIFRWSFIGAQDLHIFATWTEPEYRGQGLAVAALREAIVRTRKPGRRYWYIAREENEPSIRVCRKASFQFAGFCARKRRLGFRLRDQFILTDARVPDVGNTQDVR